jgi:hypothetical protein
MPCALCHSVWVQPILFKGARMRRWAKFVVLVVGCILAIAALHSPLIAQSQLTEQSRLAIDGIGPIRVGMTVAEAEKSANVTLVEKGVRAGGGGCYYLWPKTGPQDLSLMVTSLREENRILRDRDRITRVDVFSKSPITTLRGAKIGDTEARIKALYPGQIKTTRHEYTSSQGGHYLTFIPKDAADKGYRLIFETLKGRVTQFRSGKLPEVEYVEGCA